jgi:hypothetical protein
MAESRDPSGIKSLSSQWPSSMPGRGRVHIGVGINWDAKGSFARAAMKGVIERVDLHWASSAVFPAWEAD